MGSGTHHAERATEVRRHRGRATGRGFGWIWD
jgi:hypothetical protein